MLDSLTWTTPLPADILSPRSCLNTWQPSHPTSLATEDVAPAEPRHEHPRPSTHGCTSTRPLRHTQRCHNFLSVAQPFRQHAAGPSCQQRFVRLLRRLGCRPETRRTEPATVLAITFWMAHACPSAHGLDNLPTETLYRQYRHTSTVTGRRSPTDTQTNMAATGYSRPSGLDRVTNEPSSSGRAFLWQRPVAPSFSPAP